MKKSEKDLEREILVACNAAGYRVWKNEVGQGYAGRGTRSGSGVVIPFASTIRYGLCVGSADLIGISPGGRFIALEVKTERGRLSEAQEAFLGMVQGMGGISGCVRSVDEAMGVLEGAEGVSHGV